MYKKIFTILILSALLMAIRSNAQEQLEFMIDNYDQTKACNGTTLFSDNSNLQRPRVVEIDMNGNIVWEYVLPADFRRYTNPGFDVEALANNNILLTFPGKGVYEIDRKGNIVWFYADEKISHDADRLPNGNTLYVFGNEDKVDDAQVKEVSKDGEIVWAWYAKKEFDREPFRSIYDNGWTHANAVERLSNGNTLISLRNFHSVVEVDPEGEIIRKLTKKILKFQHDPQMLSNGHILLANHGRPQAVMEVDFDTEEILWHYDMRDSDTWPVRDADRLSNGNTLITSATKIIEVTPDKEIVWQLSMKNVKFQGREGAGRGFYKAQRIS